MNTKPAPNTAAINSLKQQGFSVKIKHFRRKAFKDKTEPLIADATIRSLRSVFPDISYGIVSQTGGATVLELKRGEEEIVIRADCYVKDAFCKKIGVLECLKRLEKLHNIKP